MANKVFANGMEIACKAAAGKVICAFPDVCMTPPENPATPPGVPVPYPNTAMASDTTDGSKNVKISDKEIMLKNKSCFKTSTGDEAGCAAKKGLISNKNKGKVYFIKWSMNVKVEGENVDRHFDMTTNNHGSTPNEALPWMYIDSQTMAAGGGDCSDEIIKEKTACEQYKPYGDEDPCPEHTPPSLPDKYQSYLASIEDLPKKEKRRLRRKAKKEPYYKEYKKKTADYYDQLTKNVDQNDCLTARRCRLVPYNAKHDGENGCCPGQTPHHVIPKSSFYKISVSDGKLLDATPNYNADKAPCICLEGTNNTHATHGLAHTAHAYVTSDMKKGKSYPLSKHNKACSKAVKEAAPNCSQKCLEQQVKTGHEKAGVEGDPDVKHSPSGRTKAGAQEKAKAVAEARRESFGTMP